jgi:hypothetical protein
MSIVGQDDRAFGRVEIDTLLGNDPRRTAIKSSVSTNVVNLPLAPRILNGFRCFRAVIAEKFLICCFSLPSRLSLVGHRR